MVRLDPWSVAIALYAFSVSAHQTVLAEQSKAVTVNELTVTQEVRAAAELGSANHEFTLGLFYEIGYGGIRQDYEKAATWYHRAAEQGHAEAQHYLGQLYLHGDGVLINHGRAREWFEKSAEQGHQAALCDLGNIYYNGLGVQRDFQRARIYLDKGALLDDSWCQYWLGRIYALGDGVSVDYVKAHDLLRRSAGQGSSNAAYELALLYRDGKGVEKSTATAIKWLEFAATKTDSLDVFNALQELKNH